MAKTFGKFSDLIDFSRASGGTALRRVGYGSELITNGTFDIDSGWLKSNDVTISGGAANIVSTGTYQYVAQTNVLEVDKIYQVTYDIVSPSTGSLKASTSFDGVSNISSSVGSHSFVGKAKITTLYIERDSICNVLIDNISVKEVLFDQPNAPLTLINHPTNVPRIEYDADGNRLGLLIEEARTNIALYSENLTQWSALNATIQADFAIAPNGTQTADKIIPDATSNQHGYYRSTTVSGSTNYTQTIYAKAGEYSWFYMTEGNTLTARAFFDLSTGVVGTVTGTGSPSAAIIPVGNGWYRCQLTFTTNSGQTSANIQARVATADNVTTFTGNGYNGIYVWAAQEEAGSFPTSYIPTSGAAATRAADIASIPVSEFGYNQSEGSVVVDLRYNGAGTSPRILCFSDGTDTNRIVLDRIPLVTVINNNSITVSKATTSASSVLTPYKVGLSLSDSNTSITIDGETPSTSSGTIPKVISKLIIGDGQTSPRYLNGHIKSINYYPRRLTNQQLQDLTT